MGEEGGWLREVEVMAVEATEVEGTEVEERGGTREVEAKRERWRR